MKNRENTKEAEAAEKRRGGFESTGKIIYGTEYAGSTPLSGSGRPRSIRGVPKK